MPIAALYDIHGNLPALEAVLAELGADLGAEADLQVLVGGDVVPGPMPAACLERLGALPWPTHFIQGNGEQDVLSTYRGVPLSRVPRQFHGTMRWVTDQLTPAQLETLQRWPRRHRAEVEGVGRVLFCHATPWNEADIFTRLTPEEALLPVFEGVEADVVVCGHTHMQFRRRVGEVEVINAGSVGLPFGSAGAFWLLLGPDGAELRRTDYDLPAATAAIQATDYPQAETVDLTNPPPEERMLQVFEASAIG